MLAGVLMLLLKCLFKHNMHRVANFILFNLATMVYILHVMQWEYYCLLADVLGISLMRYQWLTVGVIPHWRKYISFHSLRGALTLRKKNLLTEIQQSTTPPLNIYFNCNYTFPAFSILPWTIMYKGQKVSMIWKILFISTITNDITFLQHLSLQWQN